MIIPNDLYAKIHESLPIFCLDLVIVQDQKILLVKRNREPAKDQYWFPGGRMFKGEQFMDTARRIAQGEVGIHIDSIQILGADNLVFAEDPFGHGKGTHTPTCIIKCNLVTNDIKLDQNHDEFLWWDPTKPIDGLHSYVALWALKAL